MIRLQLIGRIGKDATVKKLEDGRQVINFSVAHSEKRGETEHTTWVDAAMWRKAEASVKIADYLKKGQQVYIEGEPTSRAWSASDGKTMASLGVNVSDVQLLERKAERAEVIPAQGDDLPW